ncbi:enoyl-CoA hydratase/isomerase family protein [Rhodovulum adriaticum]|uniref:3-hydroxyisobutyryl-CoA hydrolase n=1 Tax=Rhodovulum adriaticum TaxID=35804 RepID=A0A4R2NVX6_RHOAD|nr:enoyl-CoA hydratase/isomerase family protein [Rhodovulum adriaticum]MBK1635672.1 enoyl-CoA hydratase [Rhodovulum adriaticum]TCP26180.1 enoyl-CoA hydratase [Rhodovulum adriaticum]
MSDIEIRQEGRAGRITLNRPKALNALTYEMCLEIEAALDAWRGNDAVALVLIDAAGDRAFCAGGDIAVMYETGTKGDYTYGQKFWRDEYRMNAKIAEYPKPVVSLLQGFTMGGGVGVGCHGSHRVVGETAQVAMPECGIGLVPDVGGSGLLAHAPGRLGVYLGTTGRRMGPGDAIYAGFADHFVPQADWPALSAELVETGDAGAVQRAATSAPQGDLPAMQAEVDRLFAPRTLAGIITALQADGSDFATDTLKRLGRGSPLAIACAIEMQNRLGPNSSIRDALTLEFRFTHRAPEHSDFLEGIRATIIDKDKSPKWRHDGLTNVPAEDVARMLAPLGKDGLKLEEELT